MKFPSNIITSSLCVFLLFGCAKSLPMETVVAPKTETVVNTGPKQIKIGLLLDTSNSMDGLIDQAKSQIWGIINKLSTAKHGEEVPSIMFSLFEYGNDNLEASASYIREVVPLTSDLDLISQKLFSLSTKGGEEYCGAAIDQAVKQLDWSKSGEDLQIILIAGNENFNQGSVSFHEACANAKSNSVFINTIYCGDYDNGIRENWKLGAEISGGIYANIDHNQERIEIITPYDQAIEDLNDSLNKTYIYYGVAGHERKEKQVSEDKNAKIMGKSVLTSRSITKSKSVYNNAIWDLVDASEVRDFELGNIDKNTLPQQYRNLTEEQLLLVIKDTRANRIRLRKRIGELAELRAQYIQSKKTESMVKNLNDAIITAIVKQGESKGFMFN